MTINIPSLINRSSLMVREALLPVLSAQQKRVLTVAAIAFAALAACYLMIWSCRLFSAIAEANQPVIATHQPRTAADYLAAGKLLRLEEKVQFPDGTTLSQEEVFLKAIEMDPHDSKTYNYLGTLCDALSRVQLPDGSELTQQQLFLKAIEKDPGNSAAICNLASTLEGGGSMELPDGNQLTREKQFVRVIRKHKKIARPALHKIALPNSTTETKKRELYLQAIELDPSNYLAFYNLSFQLQPHESITMPDGSSMSIAMLLLHARDLNPQHAEVWSDLGNIRDTIAFRFPLDDKLDHYLKAIELDPTDASAYYNIAVFFSEAKMPDGQILTDKQLLLKGIQLDPYCYFYYRQLHALLEVDETIELLDGTRMTKQQLRDKIDFCFKTYWVGDSPSAY